MAIWKKKDKYIDLSEKIRRQEERLNDFKSNMAEENSSTSTALNSSQESSGGGFFSFFGGSSNGSSTNSTNDSGYSSAEEKRKKLAKRLSDMTTKMEDLENQIYHLKQKVEVLERKQKIGY